MGFLADLMAHDGQIAFEKCGDVVVSPKDNQIALFCHFCKDLITHLPQFLRHLHEAHGDVLHFTQEHNVYSVEELLSGEEAEKDQDAEEDENNSQGGDCEMPQVAEEPVKCEELKNTPEIDLPDEMEADSPGSTRDVLAEVEAMLLADEEDEENQQESQQDVAIKAYLKGCQGMQTKREVTKEPSIPETDPQNQRFKGGRNRKEVGLKISRLKSHAIARQSRKRMSSVKNRILCAIDNFGPKKQIPDDQEKSMQLAPMRARVPLSKTPSRPPMNASHLSVRKSTLTTARISLQMTTTTTTSSETVVSCSNEVETSYQANEEEAPCKENEILNLPNLSGTQDTRKLSPIKIRKIEILPNLNKQYESSNNAGNSDDIDIEKELAVLLGSSKNKESPSKVMNSRTKVQKVNKNIKSCITNRTQLKTTNVENKLEILLAGIDSLKTAPTNPASNTPSTSANAKETIEVLIDNCTLLKYVGLPVIHNPSYEDNIMLDELEDLRAKAVKFCKIFRNYEGIWSCRRVKSMGNDTQQLPALIQLLTQEVNAVLKCHLSETDMKRILNLISLWFRRTVELKHFKKLTLSPSTQHYFNLFSFIPQVTRFLLFCEYCNDCFPLEPAYRKHLMSHSFTIRCHICRRAFKGHGFLDKHLRACHGV
ncbi:protein teflon [Drosophila kikkawai]|uniref:Protein teflon n=1 Tax=Drosophila kikkawai TaxID=30033 RepID=A0A6P4IMB8_DROKI|nr:protein teflon [Drosophila kikkawai]